MKRTRRPNENVSGRTLVRLLRPGKGRRYYCLEWNDRQEGRRRRKSTGLRRGRKEYQQALKMAREWEESLNAGISDMTWEVFIRTYLEQHPFRKKGREAVLTADARLRQLCNPSMLVDVDGRMLAMFASRLAGQVAETSIATYIRTIKAALRWAYVMRFINEVPRFQFKPKIKKSTAMRSRAITEEEFERMLMAVESVRPNDACGFRHFLTALWLSGLRIGEAVQLSWDAWNEPFAVDLDHSSGPVYVILDQKNGEEQLLPIVPDFVGFLEKVPPALRSGRVLAFGLRAQTMKRLIIEIGKKAGVIVNRHGKTASSHDLRRAFATRWSKKVRPATLQVLMRHKSFSTTMSYYVTTHLRDVFTELRDDCADNQIAKDPKNAEGKGLEPSTGYPAPDFESGTDPDG